MIVQTAVFSVVRKPRPMKLFFHQLRSLLAFICALLSFHFLLAQYSTQGPLSGTTFFDDNSVGDFSFTSPGNAVTSDNNRSSASALLTLLNGDTHYLKVTGFGFSIPALASVTGIKVEVEKSATGINIFATVKDNEVRLLRGGIATGDNKAINSSWSGADDYDSYGDTTDAWGSTWSPTEINSSDFGVVFSAKIAGLLTLLPSARIDHIRVTVFYIIPLPIHFLSFTADTKKENEVLLKWTTADNDEKAVFTVQRSIDGNAWTDLQTIYGVVSFSTKKYQYIDRVIENANRYYYRIKMTLLSGTSLYTRIIIADIKKNDVFNLYPNPARNEVFVSHAILDQISLFSIVGEKQKVNIEKVNANRIKINTAFLRPGLYLIKAGNKQRQLLIQ